MGQEYSEVDTKVLEIVASHLTKALFNYQLIEEVEAKKTEINLKLLELETLFDISVAISSVLFLYLALLSFLAFPQLFQRLFVCHYRQK